MVSSLMKKFPLLLGALALSACEPQTLPEFVHAFQKEFKTTIRLEGTAASSDAALNDCTRQQLKIWMTDYKALPRAARKKARAQLANHKTWTIQSETTTEVLSGETVTLHGSYEHCGEEYRCEKVCARPGRDDTPRDPFGRSDPFGHCPSVDEYESCSRETVCRTRDIGTTKLRSEIQTQGTVPLNRLSMNATHLTLTPQITEDQVVRRWANTESWAEFARITTVQEFDQAVAEKRISESVDDGVGRVCGVMLPFQALLDSRVEPAYREEIVRVLAITQNTETPRPSEQTSWALSKTQILRTLAEVYATKGYPAFDVQKAESILGAISTNDYSGPHWSKPRMLATAIVMSR
jgi:hypothetical protein